MSAGTSKVDLAFMTGMPMYAEFAVAVSLSLTPATSPKLCDEVASSRLDPPDSITKWDAEETGIR